MEKDEQSPTGEMNDEQEFVRDDAKVKEQLQEDINSLQPNFEESTIHSPKQRKTNESNSKTFDMDDTTMMINDQSEIVEIQKEECKASHKGEFEENTNGMEASSDQEDMFYSKLQGQNSNKQETKEKEIEIEDVEPQDDNDNEDEETPSTSQAND